MSLSRYFKGEREPDQRVVGRFSSALDFPVRFFYGRTLDEASQEGPSFRALSKMTARLRDQAVAIGTLGMYLADWIDERFTLPEPSIPQYADLIDAETAAMAVRAEWGQGELPIKNMVHLLEKHGARIFALSADTQVVDAYSFWHGETPLVLLNTGKTAERSRMDAAHELGHLVLHAKGGSQRSREAEHEAQQFGSAFLMPRGSILGRMRPGATLPQLIKAKRHWKVSVKSLTYRLHQLKMLTKYQYSSTFVQLSSRGYQAKEPQPIPRETSLLLDKVFGQLRERGVTVAQVAADLCLRPEEVGSLLAGLTRFPVPVSLPSLGPVPTARADAQVNEPRLVEDVQRQEPS